MKKIKKILISLICIGIISSNFMNSNVYAASIIDSAQSTTVNKRYRGTLYRDESKAYKFTLTQAKKIKFKVNVSGSEGWTYLRIYNSNNKQLYYTDAQIDKNLGFYSKTLTFYLTKGVYYFVLDNPYGSKNYYFEYSTVNLSRLTQATHNTIKNAAKITANNKYYFDLIGYSNSKNFYSLDINNKGYYQLYFVTSISETTYFYIYNSNGTEIYSDIIFCNNNSNQTVYSKKIYLGKGKYFLSFDSNVEYDYDWVSGYHGIYKFRIKNR